MNLVDLSFLRIKAECKTPMLHQAWHQCQFSTRLAAVFAEEVGDSFAFPLICFANQMAMSLMAAYNGASKIATKPADHAIAMIGIAEQKSESAQDQGVIR